MSDYDPRRSKYNRPRLSMSWFGLLFGLVLGIGGALYYTWNVAPIEELDTAPWQLRRDARSQYIVAIMLNYAYDGNLTLAIERLVELRLPGDPIQAVADTACELASSGYVDSNSGLRALRAMMLFYQSQGRTGCADNLIPPVESQPTVAVDIVAATSTLIPPASKTPTLEANVQATATPASNVVPTNAPQSDFTLLRVETFCDPDLPGIIEVYVQDLNGDGIPGQAVRVRWSDGESTFFTGLKPERGPAYADFQMEAGVAYTIEMPGQSNPSDRALAAAPCTTIDTGEESVQSYRAVFRPSG